MQSLARLLLLVAALAYGAMPMTGMSAMGMPVAHAMDLASDLTASGSTPQLIADVDCPHSGQAMVATQPDNGHDHTSTPLKTSWHCAACLTLPANATLPDSGKPARAAEAATLSPRLVSQTPAPATPPPRA
jgi:hypothetical protein